ncbi:hypothetical protein BO70DRAFT_14554 [Aspergillus heteromorphus CBS 117.55]|uniref:Uncharacterized protein n=1 Tax=Aspergillus heteromorphus CBS 117.55 TaxID=1448321 RepID=A0A317X1T0_9EURO|nr:uncharacterized protein BO70DRAFT_14554 [Aspergillus heteromorphus CBS 117.55]PWY92594.1 hypothetical protein BO70DRAFT_14554 [Aspergillus heteromorphus CBS 117.55]
MAWHDEKKKLNGLSRPQDTMHSAPSLTDDPETERGGIPLAPACIHHHHHHHHHQRRQQQQHHHSSSLKFQLPCQIIITILSRAPGAVRVSQPVGSNHGRGLLLPFWPRSLACLPACLSVCLSVCFACLVPTGLTD